MTEERAFNRVASDPSILRGVTAHRVEYKANIPDLVPEAKEIVINYFVCSKLF